MRSGDLVQLEVKPRVTPDVKAFLVEMAKGKAVLNVGALGDIDFYLPTRKMLWLHAMLEDVSQDLVGLDINAEGIKTARENGYEVVEGDCQTITLDRKFDLIIMYEVIEHLDSPAVAVQNLCAQLNPGGKLVISTPNPNSLGRLLASVSNSDPEMFYDHVAEFSPESIQAMCDRHGLKLKAIRFFTPFDTRSVSLKIKSSILEGVGRLRPRLHQNFLAVVEKIN